MKDFNVLSYVGRELWAITDEKWHQMLPALVRHAKGVKLTDDEIRAFMDDDDRDTKPTSTKKGAVAIIPIRGVIAHRMSNLGMSSGGTSCEAVGAMIDSVKDDPNISQIAYDFDTPGGSVTGLQELAAKMFALRGIKKQTAIVNGLCASAGIHLATQCDEIVSIPSGMAGSIGVFSAHQDLSELLAKEGVKITLIKAGKYKTENNPFEPLTEEGKADIQAKVDEAYSIFVRDVARGRGVTPAAVRSGFGEGRVLTAKDAKAAGLIDRIATMDETLSRLTGGKSSKAGMRAEDEMPSIAALIVDVTENTKKLQTDVAKLHSSLDELHEHESIVQADALKAAADTELRDRLERF